MENKNQKLNIILRWSYRIISLLSLLSIGIAILVIGLQPMHNGEDTRINTEVISLLIAGVIGGLTVTGARTHNENGIK